MVESSNVHTPDEIEALIAHISEVLLLSDQLDLPLVGARLSEALAALGYTEADLENNIAGENLR